MRTELLAATSLSLAMVGTSAAQTFEVIRNSPDSNQISVAAGVSGDGKTAVGFAGPNTEPYGMRWEVHGGMSSLDPTQAVGNRNRPIHAANHDASVVVGPAMFGEATLPFIFSQQLGMVMLGDLIGGTLSGASKGVSGDGSTVVGWSIGQAGREAFRWTEQEGMVGLGSVPGGFFGEESSQANAISADGKVVVGYSSTASYINEPCRWVEGVGLQALGVLPGAGILGGAAYGVNAEGSVVVGNSSSGSSVIAFRWTETDGMEPLGDLPGGSAYSIAHAVSGDGQIVVGASGSPRTQGVANVEAFIWTERDGMRSLMDVIEDDFGIDLGGFHLECAYGISTDGRVIVGTGVNEDDVCQGWVLTLPKRVTPAMTSKATGR